MIPVTRQKEPPDFDVEVRKKGHNWLTANGIAHGGPPPKACDLEPYWRHSNKQLWELYGGQCAYLSIYFEWVTGASSTDHFVAKSANAGDAYEWNNYRLSCMGANRNKSKYDDVLDPIGLAPETFILNLVSGEIKPNPKVNTTPSAMKNAMDTISRLDLDSEDNNRMRQRRYAAYVKKEVSEAHLKKESPFIWYEASRQNLL